MLHGMSTYLAEHLYFPGYDQFAMITFTWGIVDLDTKSIRMYDPNLTEGVVNFDPNFNLGTGDAQKHFIDTCNKLRTLRCEVPGCLNAHDPERKLMMPPFSDEKTLSCFVDDFRNWEYGSHILPEGDAFDTTFHHFRNVANPDQFGSKAIKANFGQDIGFIDHKLKYVSIRMLTTLPKAQPYTSGKPVQELVMKFAQERMEIAPPEMKSLTVACDSFVRYDTMSHMLFGLRWCFLLTIAFAPILLVLLYKNVYVAGCVWLSWSFVGFFPLSYCALVGWDLGTAEVTATIMCIALSAYYGVQIATLYMVAGKEYGIVARHDRAEFGIRGIGGTIFLSCGTLTVACVCMFASFLFFIHKTAVLLIVTLFCNIVFSVGLLFCLLVVVGPTQGSGNLISAATIYRHFKRCLRRGLEWV